MKKMKKARGQEGIALVITLLVMTILLIMGSAFLSISSTETLIAMNERNRIQAYHLAEAGAERAIAELNINGAYPGSGGEQPLGVGTYSVTVCPPTCVAPIAAPGNPDQRIVSAMGCVRDCTAAGSAVSRLEIVVQRGSPFQFALLGLDSDPTAPTALALEDNVQVDSYDSAVGPYTPNPGTLAHIHSNQRILLGSNNIVKGNAQAVGSIEEFVPGSNQIMGSSSMGVPGESVMASTGCPAPGGAVSGISPAGAYDASTYDLTVGANETVTLQPGTYAFNRVTVAPGATLAMTGPVVICMTGQFYAQDGAVINNSGIPANLLIYSAYEGMDDSGTDAMLFGNGTGQFYGGIYALNGEVEFQNSYDGVNGWNIFGAIIGRRVDIEDEARFHYDLALARIFTPLGKFRPRGGAWRERFASN
jgi:hypothetical protein